MTPTPIRRAAIAAASVTTVALRSSLADVRQATARYHDVNVALADGFVRGRDCSENPGVGGMSIHYLNPARLI